VTPAEQANLLAIAKEISTGHIGRWADPTKQVDLEEAALRLALHAWQRDVVCTACPRRSDNHTCGCPHAQARKRLRALGVWPETVTQ
jgi:hypothetical protein